MKAASSEWYGTTPRLPVLHPTTSSSSSLSRSRHRPGLFLGSDSPSSSRYEGSFSLTSGYSFSTSTGSTSNNTEHTSSHNSNSTDYHSSLHNRNRPQRQLSKVLTPTITTSSSTSFSKSYSRGSRSRSTSTTDPTATTSTSTSKYTTNSVSEANNSDTNSRITGGGGNRPPYSFSSDANKYKRSISSQQSSSSNKGGLFPGSSRDTFTRGSSNASSILRSTTFPPIISESEISETDVAFTEEEEDDEETESGYDNTPEMPSDEASTVEEDDPVYQSFKNSLKMLRVPEDRMNRNVRVISPAISMRSVITEVDEDEEDLPPESVDDEATSYTEGDEDDGEEISSTSSYRDRTRYLRSRSGSVPKTPVKVRVKVEKAVPQTYFDDRVKVTVQVEEETEASEMDDEYDDDEGEEEDEEEEEDEDDEEENSATESDATSTNTADTVRYLSRRDRNAILGGGESQEESSSESGSEINSGSEEESEGATTSSYDKTDYPQPRRTPLFPPINGVHRDMSSEVGSINRLSTLSKSPSSMSIHDVLQQLSSNSSTETSTQSVRKSETSMDSTETGVSGSTNSEATTSGTGGNATATSAGSGTASGTTGSSPSETSSRSQSARSSLLGRASAIHKMYSVGGKVRSLSARRSLAQQRQNTYTIPSPHLPNSVPRIQLSTDSASPSITSKTSSGSSETSGSKQHLAEDQLGHAHSRSLSASSRSSRSPFSAALRQLSLGNMQAMNPQYPRGTADKAFRGESLPPISPSSPSSASSMTSSSPIYRSQLPRPLVRNLTYTVCNHSTGDSDDTTTSNNLPKITAPPPQQSTEHITLRQLIMSDRSSSESTAPGPSDEKLQENPEHVHDVLFPSNLIQKTDESKKDLLKTSQVSFAATVIEHSLSSSHTLESNSTPSEQTGSASTQRSDSAESSSESSYITCHLTGRRMKKLTPEEEEELLNKDYLTFRDLQQVDIDEPDTSKERLRHFALDTIRKQMEMERKRIESTEHEEDVFSDDYDFSEEDESGSSVYSSEEDEEGSEEEETPKTADKEISQIPVMAPSDALPVDRSGDKAADEQESQSTEPTAGEVTEKGEGELQDIIINNSDETASSFKEDLKKNFDDEATEETEPMVLSMAGTRINSAESGYRAMPPSRACSTREASLEPEEVEKEKERVLQQWKESGGTGPPPAITTSVNSNSSQMFMGGELITINYSRPNTASESANNALIQGGIDLTQELPGEEKKIAAVWEEFNRDEREGGAMADYEFSTLLDEMIMDVNSYKPKLSTAGLVSNSLISSSQSQSLQVSNQVASTSWEQPKFDPSRKYSTLSELVSLLSHNLRLVSAETLEDHMASLISLISSVLRKVRKNKTEEDYVTQVSSLSAIRVLCDRLQEMTSSQNLKYADLSWLFRVLCKYSSESDSKIRPEASFCLARLVKVAGPALVVRPIYFILVMESESGNGKSTTGAKTKAAAIDTLTYAMLTFPKEDFHNLEEIAGWVCLAMLNDERRIRQSALECLAIISQHLGGRDKALPLFHNLFLKEELDHFSRSPSPESNRTAKTGKSSKRNGKGSDPIPLSVHGTVRLLTGPGFPIAQPIDAITARLDKDVLPVPSTKGLIEYAVNVPTGKDLVLLMTHMLDKDDDEWDFSSSTDSLDSESNHSKRSSVTSLGFSDIDWTGDGPEKDKNKDENELISPDVAYILLGKGRVNKSDVVLLDTYKKEVIPEIIQLLNEKNEQGKGRKNRRRWGKNQKSKKRRKRKGQQRRRAGGGDDSTPLIPTLSFDDDTLQHDDDDDEHGLPDESLDEPLSPVAVVVDPPPDDPSKST